MPAEARPTPAPITVLALGALVVGASAAAPPARSALADVDFADPFVLRDGDTYYAFATGVSGGHVQAARSSDLATWSVLPDPLPSLPPWASRSPGFTWAPSVLRRGDAWVMYYTARDARSDFQCISRAVAKRPEGPYVDTSSRPFVCQASADAPLCGSIDPSPFVDASGRAFLLWKSDENDARCRGTSRLWAQPLSADGLDVVGEPAAILTMDRPWERPLVEGPSMFEQDGAYHLFYSANWYDTADYAIGYATCASPVGPCRKVTLDAPLVRSHGARLGPGGQEFFVDADGARWMAYHAWSAPKSSYASGGVRALRFARVSFAGGLPVVTPR
jgi:beta-xylosidase